QQTMCIQTGKSASNDWRCARSVGNSNCDFRKESGKRPVDSTFSSTFISDLALRISAFTSSQEARNHTTHCPKRTNHAAQHPTRQQNGQRCETWSPRKTRAAPLPEPKPQLLGRSRTSTAPRPDVHLTPNVTQPHFAQHP